MYKQWRRTPSAGMIIALIALFVAASGTAIASGHLLSGDHTIKKHSLSGNRLRNQTITGKQVNLAKLGTVPTAANAAHATQATSADSAPVSRLDYESANVTLSSVQSVTGKVNCPTGLDVVGGGARVADENSDYVIDSFPAGRTSWQASGYGNDGDTMTVYAVCATAAATTP